MNETEKMLESLSGSSLNYRDIIDFGDEYYYADNALSDQTYSTGNSVKSKWKRIPAFLFSFIIICGAGLYIKSIFNTSSLVNPSDKFISEAAVPVTSENNSCKEFSGSDSNTAEKIFPEIDIPETMKFRVSFMTDGEYPPQSEYIIEDYEKCAYIINLLSENCAEKSDGYKIKIADGEYKLYNDYNYDDFPYRYSVECDGSEIEVGAGQIEFLLPDSDTRLIILNNNFNTCLLVIKGSTKSYYKLRKSVFHEIADITENIVKAETENTLGKIVCGLSDSLGNDIPVSDIKLRSIGKRGINCLVSFDLSETALNDMPVGYYNAEEWDIYAYDENGNAVDIAGKGFKPGVSEENGKKFLNILVIAEADAEADLSGCTLKGNFNYVNTQETERNTKEYYSAVLKFAFEYNFE